MTTDKIRAEFEAWAKGDELRGGWSLAAFEAGYAAGAKAEREAARSELAETKGMIAQCGHADRGGRQTDWWAVAIKYRRELKDLRKKIERWRLAFPVLRTMLNARGLAGADVAQDMLDEMDAVIRARGET